MAEFEYEYNPVKEIKGNVESSKVVWSTKSIEAAVDALNKGLQLKANPFCGTNTKLLKPDLLYRRTEEEIADIVKCASDPVYFASKCSIMTPTGLQVCEMRDYQQEYLNHLKDNRFSILLAARQIGKCFFGTTKLRIKLNTEKLNYKDTKKISSYYIGDNIYDIPMFEIWNIYKKNKSTIWKLQYYIYKKICKIENSRSKKPKIEKINFLSYILSLLDYINFKYYNTTLIDNYKVIEEENIDNDIYIETDTGFKIVSNLYMTKPFKQYYILTENGYNIICADNHILFDKEFNEVFVNELKINDIVQTDIGTQKIVKIIELPIYTSMFDITVNDNNHRFYSNGILSHNSVTTAIYCLWKILFNVDKNALVLSKSGPAGEDVIKKIKDMYLYLPYYLKCGTLKWNQKSISFDNNSSISTEAFSETAGLGKTINILILDEFAWCPPNAVELFYNNIIPTVTTISDSNVCIMSTQNGFNFFYKLWKGAIEQTSMYKPFKVDWWQVPQYNMETKQWEKRTEEWHKMQVGILGSEDNFQYQYGTQFSASDRCIVSRETLSKIREKGILFRPILENIPEDNEQLWYFKFLKNLYVRPGYDIALFKNKQYIITCDMAEGGGSDYTVFNIFELELLPNNKHKLVQVAYWRDNETELKEAALVLWIITQLLFKQDNFLVSLEWNTYGELFYNYLLNYNEKQQDDDYPERFTISPEFDTNCIVYYNKGSDIVDVPGLRQFKNKKQIPGIRWNGESKKSTCALTKMSLEKGDIELYDIIQIGELENFEDVSKNGSYKASYGKDDMMMTVVQLQAVLQTNKYKGFLDEIKERMMLLNVSNNMNYGQNYY